MDTLSYDQMMDKFDFIPFNHQKPNFFPAGTQPIYDADGDVIPGHKCVVRNDTGDVLAVHSDKYSMVPYEEHFQIFPARWRHVGLALGDTRDDQGVAHPQFDVLLTHGLRSKSLIL